MQLIRGVEKALGAAIVGGLVNWYEALEKLKAVVDGPFATLLPQMGKQGGDY